MRWVPVKKGWQTEQTSVFSSFRVDPVVKVLPWDQREDALDDIALLANATSLGMTGKPPLEISLDRLPKGALVGDLIYIPPDQVHSLRPTGDTAIRCFCFAVGVKGAGPIDYTTH